MMQELKLTQSIRVLYMRFYLALAVLAILGLLTRPVEAADYKYPYRDPYLATATSAILGNGEATPRVESNIVRVPGLPGRNRLPGLERRGDVSLAFYRQNQAAPLLFIVAGVGSNPYFGVGPYLASLFYRAGSHVVILPSPMNWNFALSASRSGAPGYAPEDARDLYDVMQKTLTILRDRYDVKPTVIRFLGVSLGALEGAYLSVIDADEGKIGIANYLLINPPVDLHYALKKIDEWSSLAKNFGPQRSHELVSKALAIVDSFSDERPDDPAVIDRLAKKFSGFTTEELRYLIAETLQSQLYESHLCNPSHSRSKCSAGAERRHEKTLSGSQKFDACRLLLEGRCAIMAKAVGRSPGGPGKPSSTKLPSTHHGSAA